MPTTPIYLEAGPKKTFAVAVDWPGWSRAGRNADEAIKTLAEYAERYASVPKRAGIRFPLSTADSFEVVETVTGNATTDFGAPGIVADVDRTVPAAPARRRLAALTEASWAVFDDVRAITPEHLVKGPRGGGRDRDTMFDHVLGAESSYVRHIGVRHKQPKFDEAEAIAALRADTVAAILSPPDDIRWPLPYLVRRLVWHVLDHAWEMEDKTPRP